ncbi:hypothetical protein [uncultured Ruminococcus sp.]|uniref:hypothetical protein n=1 Tax=uncultured Ruminococcus sp. TaxID=165186 RepID=UPI0025D7825F|nr:hypothetical protein [uncultured Ruminococcus sp.]
MNFKRSSLSNGVLKLKKHNTLMMNKNFSKFISDNLYLIVFMLFAMCVMIRVFYGVITYELSHAYTADAPLYWAVGRGMLNGLTPYSDMYENKPIGVFLLSAISFCFTDSTILCNWISILAVIIIAFVPSLNIYDNMKKELLKYNKDNKAICIYGFFCFWMILFCSTMLAIYAEERSGGFQVEAIGTACSLLYINSVRKMINAQSQKMLVARTVVTAVYISLTVMLKEPFLVVATICAFLFVDKFRDFIRVILIPDITGAVLTLALLGATGVLKPYFTIYIKHMFNTRLSDNSSTISKTGNIQMLESDIMSFNKILLLMILIAIVLTLIAVYKKSAKHILLHSAKVVAAVYLASFCVGLGGQYYNHHYIFAVPVYASVLMYGGESLNSIKVKNKYISGSIITLCIVAMANVFFSSETTYSGRYDEKYDSIKKNAQYVDELLDFYEVDRYQFLGFNGEDEFFGLTEHSPQGPSFAQDPDNFQTEDTWFFQQLMKQIDNSDIIILDSFSSVAIENKLNEILSTKFDKTPPKENDLIKPDDFNYEIYYRIDR